MGRFLFSLCLALIAFEINAQLEGTPEDKECIAEGHDVIGVLPDDPKYSEWMACVYKKMFVIGADGNIDEEVYYAFVLKYFREEYHEKILSLHCEKTPRGDTDAQTAFDLTMCIAQYLPKLPNNS